MNPAPAHPIRNEWSLDPEWLTVNHGSFGATPTVVLQAQAEWRARMERQPSAFMHDTLPTALRAAAAALAAFLGAEAQDLAFLDNATTGCNAVLRSLRLNPDDEIVVLTHGYNAVRNTVRYVAERAGARMVEAELPFPDTDDAIVAALEAALTPRTRLAVLDHITSPTALILPVAAMTAACHARNVPVLVDGAHAPGQVALDLAALDADWYTGNLHKWLCAPKGSAFLWSRRDRQHDLHPTTISHGLDAGYLAEFDWPGTRDFTPYLATEAALAFHEKLGGPTLRARNAALAGEAAEILSAALQTESHHSPGGSMAIIRLPTAGPATRAHAAELRARLLAARTDAPVMPQDSKLWLRISAAAYNDRADYERLAEIVTRVFQANA